MEYVKCVKCGKETEIDIAKAVDEDAEVFRCQHCGFKFMYTHK